MLARDLSRVLVAMPMGFGNFGQKLLWTEVALDRSYKARWRWGKLLAAGSQGRNSIVPLS